MQSHRDALHAPSGLPGAGVGLLAALAVLVTGVPDEAQQTPRATAAAPDLEAAFGPQARPRDDVFLGFSPAPVAQLQIPVGDEPLALARLEQRTLAALGGAASRGAPNVGRSPTTSPGAALPGLAPASAPVPNPVATRQRASLAGLSLLPSGAPLQAAAARETPRVAVSSTARPVRPMPPGSPAPGAGSQPASQRFTPRAAADLGRGAGGDGATDRAADRIASRGVGPRRGGFESRPDRDAVPSVGEPLLGGGVPSLDLVLAGNADSPAAPPFVLGDGVDPAEAIRPEPVAGPPPHAGPVVVLGASVAPDAVGQAAPQQRAAPTGGMPVQLTPEPATALLLGGGLLALALRRRR